MKGLAIRWRLTLWYSGILAVILLLFGGVVYFLMANNLLNRLDRQLAAELHGVDEELEEASTTAGLRARLHRRFGHYENLLFDIRDVDGEEPLFTRRLGDTPFPDAQAANRSQHTSYQTYKAPVGGNWRIASRELPGPNGPLLARVAGSLTADEHELNELLVSLATAGLLAMAAAVAGGYVLARRALAPIDRMTRLAKEISAGQLNRRIEVVNQRDELGHLARTLNDMIGRLEKAFADMQRFTADAAHELRTPITIMRSEAEVTLRAPRTAEEYRKSLESLLEEFERLAKLADQLLYLCREDAGMTRSRHAEVQLDKIATDVVDHMHVLAKEKGVELALSKNKPCLMIGDADGFRRLIFNLIDNAVKYTPHGGQVTVSLDASDGQVELAVSDTGVGIPAEHLPRVCDRFYRVDSSRQSGAAGLGLAICRAIVESHGGQMKVESEPQQGTTVTVVLDR